MRSLPWPLILASLLYVWQTLWYHFENRPGLALAFAGYVIANVGLIWDAVAGR